MCQLPSHQNKKYRVLSTFPGVGYTGTQLSLSPSSLPHPSDRTGVDDGCAPPRFLKSNLVYMGSLKANLEAPCRTDRFAASDEIVSPPRWQTRSSPEATRGPEATVRPVCPEPLGSKESSLGGEGFHSKSQHLWTSWFLTVKQDKQAFARFYFVGRSQSSVGVA